MKRKEVYQPPELDELSRTLSLSLLISLSAEAGWEDWGDDSDSGFQDWGNGGSSVDGWGGSGSSVNGWGNGGGL